ncbi:MAG: aminotransferase [Flavobacteriales bacterium CG_4_8_14_3_um_filter_35_10]|nr:aminotransferase class V-fold PLP-dependent enzyme [Zetaproteobacteria bacterium]OIO10905.1 MAG: aminotransferase class V [Flavobacteriaceae bacterium CG1_02_35_72]PIR14447.1 MAG: aminotransferase [Flavobacteriales bacterium CG11_big_fil_rev_8_21_14_0_20_35_7]PIX05840.1 MAG: aminotransferase [Flavobacteriales bacterium CG_4_8_14_3_um_filter_35_10]PJA05448.1 MAG: aminotransferase [Flavobacteriales bacterium CG_4_10_14_0_2_um_filter_35_18]
MQNQAHLFSLPADCTYLNGAYMSPLLNSVAKIGQENLLKKQNPTQISGSDFFIHTKTLKQKFAQLIELDDYEQIAVIPSVSYGMATVANNIVLKSGDEIVLLQEQFPSNVYVWQKLADKYGAKIVFVAAPKIEKNRAQLWNKAVLKAINSKTAVVALPQNHWADGTLFDLIAIRKKSSAHHALLIIDGTQSVGALPFSVAKIQPDALICAGYKWLLGAYGLGLAYYSKNFNQGNPIEENWINRYNSEDFTGLVNYESRYQPKAGRYNMGEFSNFVYTPMLTAAIEQILEWKTQNIQDYCQQIAAKAVNELQSLGCFIEDEAFRAKHLFGIYLPDTIDIENLKASFNKHKIFVSFRGKAIRVSPNIYNTKADFDNLLTCFKEVIS